MSKINYSGISASRQTKALNQASTKIEQLDADRSGDLSLKELQQGGPRKTTTAKTYQNDHIVLTNTTRADKQGMTEKDFKRLDKDGDGKVTADELVNGWAAKVDKNGDRNLSAFEKFKGASFSDDLKKVTSEKWSETVEQSTVKQPYELAAPGSEADMTLQSLRSVAQNALKTQADFYHNEAGNHEARAIMSGALQSIHEGSTPLSDPRAAVLTTLVDAAFANLVNLGASAERKLFENTLKQADTILAPDSTEKPTLLLGMRMAASAALACEPDFYHNEAGNDQARDIMSGTLQSIRDRAMQSEDPKLKPVISLVDAAFKNIINLDAPAERKLFKSTLESIVKLKD